MLACIHVCMCTSRRKHSELAWHQLLGSCIFAGTSDWCATKLCLITTMHALIFVLMFCILCACWFRMWSTLLQILPIIADVIFSEMCRSDKTFHLQNFEMPTLQLYWWGNLCCLLLSNLLLMHQCDELDCWSPYFENSRHIFYSIL